MPYSSFDDMMKWIPATYTSAWTAEQAEASIIADADAVIDARLARRYVVPFASEPERTPPIIRRISKSIAAMDLLDRAPNTPDWITGRIQRDMEMLDRLAEGLDSVVGVDGAIVPERSDTNTIRVAPDHVPTFGVQPSLSERVDPDRALAEADARGTAVDID